MKILTLTALVLSGLATTASSAVVDAFDLDVTSAAGTNSNITLNAGQMYEVTVSGVFTLGNSLPRHYADAEYFNFASLPSNPINATSIEIGVGIDGQDVDFGAYTSSHVYSTQIIGDGTDINLFFADSDHADNAGTLRVEISTVPLPASALLMLTGLSGFGIARRKLG